LPIILTAVMERWPHEARRTNPITVIKDPGPGIVNIEPGGSVSGDIRLGDEFDHFAETLKKGNIIVLWSYQLETADHIESDRVAGWIQMSTSPPN